MSVATDVSLAPTGRIGLMGISFSGGLAIVAAGRPGLRNRLLYVFALGGHDDLRRVLRFLGTGIEPTPPGAKARRLDTLDIQRRSHATLGPLLLPHLESLRDVPALSPSRSPAPRVPVFLLHGSSDAVIPAAESEYLANRLRGRVPVRLLVTDLISHAEPGDRARAIDLLHLGRFWGDMLAR